MKTPKSLNAQINWLCEKILARDAGKGSFFDD